MFLFANVFGSTIQISSLPLIVLSPLQSIGLVFNTIFHTIMLNEPFTNMSLIGTILVSIGAFCTAYCAGNLTEPDYTLKQFLKFCEDVNFQKWVFCNVSLISVMIMYIFMVNTRSHQTIRRWPHITYIFPNDELKLSKITGMLCGVISGIMSAFSLLLAKSSIEILISTIFSHDWVSLTTPATSLIVAIFIVLGLSQLFLLNKGLQYISTSVLYPLVFLIYNMTSIANSLIFFQQWSQLNYFTFTILIVGSSLVMAGVFALSMQDNPNDENGEISIKLNNHTSSSSWLESPQRLFVDTQNISNDTIYRDDFSVDGNHSDSTDENVSPTANVSATSDIMTPIFQRTRANLSNATRKVHYFLNPQQQSTAAASNTTISRETTPLTTDLHQYISFESLRDLPTTRSRPSSIVPGTHEYESILQNLDNDTTTRIDVSDVTAGVEEETEGDSTLSHGLGILQPIIGKLKKQASMHDLAETVTTADTSTGLVSSSFKSALSLPFSLKHLASQTPLTSADHQDGGESTDRRLRLNRSSTLRNKLDEVEDYNPNNTFNYSANNTLEEIQAQMGIYEAPVQQYSPQKQHSPQQQQKTHIQPYSQPTSPRDNMSVDMRKLFVAKHRHNTDPIQQGKYNDLRRLTVAGGELPRNNKNVRGIQNRHTRVLSFEQTELLNTLKK